MRKEIAHELGISPNTVRYHIENAMAKLAAKTIAHAVALHIAEHDVKCTTEDEAGY